MAYWMGTTMFVRIAFTVFSFLVMPASVLAEGVSGVDVAIDEVRLVRLDADAAEIIIGNPAIADVTAQSPRILVLTGKSYGATNLIVLNATGQEIFNAQLSVNEGRAQIVKLYKGTMRQSLHCAPECQRMLTIGDDKSQFEQIAESVTKKFGVVQSAVGNDH
jgi:hypothetical protein